MNFPQNQLLLNGIKPYIFVVLSTEGNSKEKQDVFKNIGIEFSISLKWFLYLPMLQGIRHPPPWILIHT